MAYTRRVFDFPRYR